VNGQCADLKKYKILSRERSSIYVVDGDWDFNGRAELSGPIWQNQMELNYRTIPKLPGYEEEKIVQLGKKRFVVGRNNLNTVFRHETGHQVLGHAREYRKEWIQAWKEIGETKIKKQISIYAGEKPTEFFAETFTIYTSPEFVTGSLNKALNYDIESIIKKCLAVDPSTY